jgi:hypothetical protein
MNIDLFVDTRLVPPSFLVLGFVVLGFPNDCAKRSLMEGAIAEAEGKQVLISSPLIKTW